MKALILAAGYGTRLYPIIKDTPKPLLEIGQRPLIDYLLDRIKELPELNEILVVTNDKFYRHFVNWAKDLRKFPVRIRVINDRTDTPENRLGSIGDIQYVIQETSLKEDLIVIGGDNLFDFHLNDFLRFALQKRPAVTIGAYDIKDLDEARKFGVLQTDKNSLIISFEEKPVSPKSGLISMCAYFFPQSSLDLFNVYLKSTSKSDKAGEYIQWLLRQINVYGFQFQGKWYDIGSVESYHAAQNDFIT